MQTKTLKGYLSHLQCMDLIWILSYFKKYMKSAKIKTVTACLRILRIPISFLFYVWLMVLWFCFKKYFDIWDLLPPNLRMGTERAESGHGWGKSSLASSTAVEAEWRAQGFILLFFLLLNIPENFHNEKFKKQVSNIQRIRTFRCYDLCNIHGPKFLSVYNCTTKLCHSTIDNYSWFSHL